MFGVGSDELNIHMVLRLGSQRRETPQHWDYSGTRCKRRWGKALPGLSVKVHWELSYSVMHLIQKL